METPDEKLIEAASVGDLEACELALREGANIDARKDGVPLLHIGIIDYIYQLPEYLVGQGADVNATDEDGFTALHLAANKGWKDLVLFLMEHGADRQKRTNPTDDKPNGETPREMTPPDVVIKWDALGDDARRALESKDCRELAYLLLSHGHPTQALLELCGTHRIIELFHPGRWTRRESEALGLFEQIEPSLPDYWRNLSLIDLAPLRYAAVVSTPDAVPRYAKTLPGRF